MFILLLSLINVYFNINILLTVMHEYDPIDV
jgi:hypothetical protein